MSTISGIVKNACFGDCLDARLVVLPEEGDNQGRGKV
jgi:hypothetical protein